ncbi:hypothetical protein ABVN80_11305 [Acinetobacter baumannii]
MRHIICLTKKLLQRFNLTQFLINSARGPVVKEVALIGDIQRTQHCEWYSMYLSMRPVISEELLNMLAFGDTAYCRL